MMSPSGLCQQKATTRCGLSTTNPNCELKQTSLAGLPNLCYCVVSQRKQTNAPLPAVLSHSLSTHACTHTEVHTLSVPTPATSSYQDSRSLKMRSIILSNNHPTATPPPKMISIHEHYLKCCLASLLKSCFPLPFMPNPHCRLDAG